MKVFSTTQNITKSNLHYSTGKRCSPTEQYLKTPTHELFIFLAPNKFHFLDPTYFYSFPDMGHTSNNMPNVLLTVIQTLHQSMYIHVRSICKSATTSYFLCPNALLDPLQRPWRNNFQLIPSAELLSRREYTPRLSIQQSQLQHNATTSAILSLSFKSCNRYKANYAYCEYSVSHCSSTHIVTRITTTKSLTTLSNSTCLCANTGWIGLLLCVFRWQPFEICSTPHHLSSYCYPT